ncbi:hypothetical protein [Streptomyces sp. NPDC002044]|uniref:hypothetical protein n=1 Tax=Streptomyces sp. NPDC002044 TaxID=3154662 RepID=UPI003316846D
MNGFNAVASPMMSGFTPKGSPEMVGKDGKTMVLPPLSGINAVVPSMILQYTLSWTTARGAYVRDSDL